MNRRQLKIIMATLTENAGDALGEILSALPYSNAAQAKAILADIETNPHPGWTPEAIAYLTRQARIVINDHAYLAQ